MPWTQSSVSLPSGGMSGWRAFLEEEIGAIELEYRRAKAIREIPLFSGDESTFWCAIHSQVIAVFIFAWKGD